MLRLEERKKRRVFRFCSVRRRGVVTLESGSKASVSDGAYRHDFTASVVALAVRDRKQCESNQQAYFTEQRQYMRIVCKNQAPIGHCVIRRVNYITLIADNLTRFLSSSMKVDIPALLVATPDSRP